MVIMSNDICKIQFCFKKYYSKDIIKEKYIYFLTALNRRQSNCNASAVGYFLLKVCLADDDKGSVAYRIF